MAFLAPSYTWRHKMVSTTVKRSVFTSTARRYVRGTTEHPGLDAKVDVDAYCSLIIFLPIFCLLHFHSHFSSYNRSAILLILSILLLSFQRLIYQQRGYIHYHTSLHFQQQQQQQQQ